MTTKLVAYIATLVPLVVIDLLWLGYIARSIYMNEIGNLLRKSPELPPAVAFYLLYASGLVVFAVLPGLRAGSAGQAMLLGAFLGLVAYGTYDLTNFAVLNGYTLKLTLIDIAWGTLVSGTVSWLSVVIVSRVVSA